MGKKLFLGFVFVTLKTIIGNAQISATIVDDKTKLPIPNATILLQNINDTAFKKNIFSQANGFFEWYNLAKSKYILTITNIGYVMYNVIIELNGKSNPLDTIWLSRDIKNLAGVTVISKKPFIEFTGGKIILNVAESPIASSGNAYEAIGKVPGVVALNDGTIKLRGKSVLVVIDNKKTYLSGEDLKEYLTAMPASNIEKIEALPTPSSNYDAEAQTVINIKTIKNKAYGMNGVLTLGAGEGIHARYNTGLNLNYRTTKYNMFGNYSFDYNNTFLEVATDQNPLLNNYIIEISHENRIRNNKSYKVGIDLDLNKSNTIGISFSGFLNHRDRATIDIVTIKNFGAGDTLNKVNTVGNYLSKNQSYNIFFKHLFGANGKTLIINADHVLYNRNIYDNISTEYYLLNGSDYKTPYDLRDTSNSKSAIHSFGIDLAIPVKNGRFDVGGKATFTKVDNNLQWQYQNANNWITDTGLTKINQNYEDIYSLYLSRTKNIGKFEITSAIRCETTTSKSNLIPYSEIYNRKFLDFFPFFKIEYKKGEENNYTFSYRKSIHRPSFYELSAYLNYYSNYSYYSGNSNLLPQYDNDFNISYNYKNLNIGLDFAHSTNVIMPNVTKIGNNLLYYKTANIPYLNFLAIVINWNHQINKIWWFNISNNLQYSTYSQDGKSNYLNRGFSYQGDIKNTFSFNGGWSSEIVGNYNSAGPFGVYQSGAGYLSGLDFSIQKTIFNGVGKVSVILNDFLNTQVDKYSTSLLGISLNKSTKSESRFIRISLVVKLGKKSIKPRLDRKTIEDLKTRLNG